MTIRKAKIKDVAKLVLLAIDLLKYHENFDPYFTPAKDVKDVYAKFFKGCIFSTTKQLLVAEHDRDIIAYALGEISSRPSVFKIRNIGVINDMFVAKKFRKTRIAKKLLAELLCWFKDKGLKYPRLNYVELSVHTKNEIGQKAWAKYGFKEFMSKQRMKI